MTKTKITLMAIKLASKKGNAKSVPFFALKLTLAELKTYARIKVIRVCTI